VKKKDFKPDKIANPETQNADPDPKPCFYLEDLFLTFGLLVAQIVSLYFINV